MKIETLKESFITTLLDFDVILTEPYLLILKTVLFCLNIWVYIRLILRPEKCLFNKTINDGTKVID